jgi:integrase
MRSSILRKQKTVGERNFSLSDLQLQVLKTVKHYARLTVRQLYYVLTSRLGFLASHKFYKILDYHLTKMRRLDPRLNAKFVDPTRRFVAAPRPYNEVELWVEKETIRTLLEKLASKYRLSIQVLRGFAPLSMFRKALRRASERGVKKILYIGDFDASGLLIDKIAQKEMQTNMIRIALTLEQTRKYRLPSLPVNMKDSRAAEYARALNFMRRRKQLARTLANPRIQKVTFHSFRHFYASMLYFKTKNILYVKQQLGHRCIENTMVYTQLINFESDEWHVAHAKTLDEEDKLVQAGFEFVRYDERENVAIYRKRK